MGEKNDEKRKENDDMFDIVTRPHTLTLTTHSADRKTCPRACLVVVHDGWEGDENAKARQAGTHRVLNRALLLASTPHSTRYLLGGIWWRGFGCGGVDRVHQIGVIIC